MNPPKTKINWNFFGGKEFEKKQEQKEIELELAKEYMRLELELKKAARLYEYKIRHL